MPVDSINLGTQKARRKMAGLVYQRAGAYTSGNAITMCCRDSHAQHSLHSHSMAAVPPVLEEATGAVPLPMIIVSGVDIIFTSKCRLEARKLNSLGFFRIA